MKFPHLALTLFVPAFLAPALFAQATDYPGNVSPVTINLTLQESIGGTLVTEAKRITDFGKGITYKDDITYDTVYLPNQTPGRSLLNPFGWDTSKGNYYVESTTSSNASGSLVVTANGSHVISTTRYTNATLLADLVAAGLIDSATGYRIVAVRADSGGPVLYNNGTYATQVNDGLYFFAERGTADPAPIFLGAENDVYDYAQVIDFEAYESAQAGKYTDTFTGTDNGFAYAVLSDAYKGVSLAEFALYRPGPNNTYYKIRAGGPFTWSETYDAKNHTYTRGPITGKTLSGPARLYEGSAPADNATVTDQNIAVVTGTITLPNAAYQSSLKRYLDRIPPVAQ